MSNRFQHILKQWQTQKDDCEWVLATIIETKGSAYRKAGARMMINSFGKGFGLLSGGCLESDLMQQARKCWENDQNHIVTYDMQDESDIAWQLGIGCGGMVRVLLQPINTNNDYLALDEVLEKIECGESVYYSQTIDTLKPDNRICLKTEYESNEPKRHNLFINIIKPIPKLTIFGGGTDAVPLVNMAKELGWQVTLIDSRTNYARPAYFPLANEIIKQPYELLKDNNVINASDAIVIMNHNLALDAKALSVSANTPCQYIGLLGPSHRTERVFKLTDLQLEDVSERLSNPIGLHLGGELPESIALSMLAEIHAILESGSMLRMKNQVKRN